MTIPSSLKSSADKISISSLGERTKNRAVLRKKIFFDRESSPDIRKDRIVHGVSDISTRVNSVDQHHHNILYR